MAIADMVAFDPVNAISADRKWFHYKRVKNGKKCTVPLLPMLERVISRNKWPVEVKERMLAYYMEDYVTPLVGRKVTPHSGRHTFGSIMLELGFSMEAVSKMMGHGSIQTTERHYAKVTKDKIAREWEEIPEKIKQLMNDEI
jgi:site-specific recombinase XerD